VYALYDGHEALPKRPRSAAQHAALATAQVAQRTCTRCGTVAAHRLPQRRCGACIQSAVAAAERERLRALQAVAVQWLTDPTAVILDTETTDLDGSLVQIAVMDMAGTVLLETLVNPLTPISDGAYQVHGMREAQVQAAPTFAELADQLHVLLQGRLVMTYNAGFDRHILGNELLRFSGAERWQQACAARDRWLETMQWGCAMALYAAWYGDWAGWRRG
jgi:hypothetical protein